MIINETIKKNAMKTFKIEFLDNNQNELWTKTIEAYDWNEAYNFANAIFSNSNVNDLYTFRIDEI